MNPQPPAPRTAEERLAEDLANNMAAYLRHPINGASWHQAKVEALGILRQHATPTIPAVEAAARDRFASDIIGALHPIMGGCGIDQEDAFNAALSVITKHLALIGHAQDEKTVREEADRTVEAKIPYHSQQEKAGFVDVLLEFRAKHLAPSFQGGVERDLPDIGPDPLKLPTAEWQKRAHPHAAWRELRKPICLAQTGVPDQMALVWRADLSRAWHSYIRLSTMANEPTPDYGAEDAARIAGAPPPQNEAGTAFDEARGEHVRLKALVEKERHPFPTPDLRGTIERVVSTWDGPTDLTSVELRDLTDRLCTALAGFGAGDATHGLFTVETVDGNKEYRATEEAEEMFRIFCQGSNISSNVPANMPMQREAFMAGLLAALTARPSKDHP